MIEQRYEEIIYQSRKRLFSSGYGVWSSPLYGDGGEFAEIGEYSGGDIRHLNYKATAKSGSPKINLYHDNRRLDVILLYIASASMTGGDIRSKHSLAVEILTALSYSASVRGDRVSALIYSDDDSKYIAGYRGDKIAKIIYERVSTMELAGREAQMDRAFDEVARLAKRRSLIFVISDFFEMSDIDILSYRHETVLIRIRERAEEYPNLLNNQMLIDPFDRSELYGDCDSATLKRYRDELMQIDRFWQNRSQEDDMILAPLYTDSDPYPILKKALQRAKERVL